MSKEKRYRLLKDLPDAKAGTILEYDGNSCYDYKSLRTDLDADPEHLSWYKKEFVENNPTWFEEIKEENKSNDSFQWTDELVKEFITVFWILCNPDAVPKKMFYFKESHTPKPQAENKLWDFCSECNQKNICSFYGGCRKSANAEYEAAAKIFPQSEQENKPERRYFHNNDPLHGWETKNKPDWEIVVYSVDGFMEMVKDILFKKQPDGNFLCFDLRTPELHNKLIPENELKKFNVKIHSVKRPSTSELFSVDEYAGTKHLSRDRIKEFYVKDGEMYVVTDNDSFDFCWLSKLPPQPQKEEQRPKEQPDRIKINVFECVDMSGKLYANSFQVPIKFREKFSLIKQVVEKVLNNEAFAYPMFLDKKQNP